MADLLQNWLFEGPEDVDDHRDYVNTSSNSSYYQEERRYAQERAATPPPPAYNARQMVLQRPHVQLPYQAEHVRLRPSSQQQQQTMRRLSSASVLEQQPVRRPASNVENTTQQNNVRRVSEPNLKRPNMIAAVRRPNPAVISQDAKLVVERKLQEALDREKHQQLQINELKRKMAGLEERVRVVKIEKRRMEKRQVDNLESRVLASMQRVVQDRECDAKLKDKIAEAVAHAVAQTLLNADAGTNVVAPPRRAPPSSSSLNNNALVHI